MLRVILLEEIILNIKQSIILNINSIKLICFVPLGTSSSKDFSLLQKRVLSDGTRSSHLFYRPTNPFQRRATTDYSMKDFQVFYNSFTHVRPTITGLSCS